MKAAGRISWRVLVLSSLVLVVVAVQQPLPMAHGSGVALPQAAPVRASAQAEEGHSQALKAGNNVISVVVHPLNAPVTSMVQQQFTANVHGTKNQAVTWYVDGIQGGNDDVGTISTTGLYTPPSNFEVGTHTVEAISQANNNAYGTATVYLVSYAGQYTNKNDNYRTGQNLEETVLTPQNVNVSSFGKLFYFLTDGQVMGQPLYVSNLYIPSPENGSPGYHNVVYIVTENDSLYAYDADGKVNGPLWQDSFINPPTVIPVPGTCVKAPMTAEWGITVTPVIDPTTNTIYVEVRTLENSSGCTGTYVHRLHALDITTGEEKFGGPVVIQASVPGTGVGSQNGVLAFDPHWEHSRPGLLLSQAPGDNDSMVYLGAASLNDTEPYHGWILGYDSQTLALTYVYCTTPDGEAGGVWQMGGGLAADENSNLFVQTGNGTFDDVSDFGESVLELTPSNGNLTLADYYTPDNYAFLTSQDWDVSSGGALLLPDQPGNYPHLLIGGGKEGTIYVIDRDSMGEYDPNGNNIVQYIVGAIRASVPNEQPFYGIWNTSSYFQGNVYIFGNYDYPKMFTLNNGLLPTTPTSTGTFEMRSPAAIISANGTNNGIVWVLQQEAPALRAFDPFDLTQEYYDTTQDPNRDRVGTKPVTRADPMVANGRVYVPANGKVQVYGLLQ